MQNINKEYEPQRDYREREQRPRKQQYQQNQFQQSPHRTQENHKKKQGYQKKREEVFSRNSARKGGNSDSYSNDFNGSENSKGSFSQKQVQQIDPNGHNPSKQVDSQYDRSKIDHFYDDKDTKFNKEKRFNLFQKEKDLHFNGHDNHDHVKQKHHDISAEEIIEQTGLDINFQEILDEKIENHINWKDLYNLFKLSEKYTAMFYQKQREDQVIFEKEEMDPEVFKLFQQLARILILSDLEAASEKKIDQRLWDVYKKKIEQNKSTKLVSTNLEDQFHIFDSKIYFLRNTVKDVVTKYQNELSSQLKSSNKKRRIIANLCCNFGELIELKEKVSRKLQQPNFKNMEFAAGQYLKSISIYPFCGKFFLVLATLSHMSEDSFSAIYWCIRALSCEQEYPCKEKLQEFLELNRQKCKKFTKEYNTYGQIEKKDQFKVFILHFLSFINIVLTKIGIENIGDHVSMFEHLQNHIRSIIEAGQQQNFEESAATTLLGYVIFMLLFSLHKLQEYIKTPLSTQSIKSDQMVSTCLKYSQAILSSILELFIQSEVNSFVNLVVPVVCYLQSHEVLSEYLFQFAALQSIFNKVLLVAKRRYAQFKQDIKQNLIEKLADNYLSDIEMQMIGFTPFSPYFNQDKDEFNILGDESMNYPLKLFIIIDKLQKIDSFVISVPKADTMQENKDKDDFFFLKSTPKKENQKEEEKQRKQLIVIDGMNVAIRHGASTFSAKGLQIAVDFWVNHHSDVHVFLPDFCFSQDSIESKRKKYMKENQQEKFKTLPDDVSILLKLREQGYATGIPDWNYDDSYIIEFARKKDAFVLTNDRYNDHINQFKGDQKKMEIVKQWIRNNCMSFTFIKDELQPDPDFLQKRTTVSLVAKSTVEK